MDRRIREALVVDSDALMARLVVYKLVRSGFAARYVQDGAEALEFMAQHDVDVLITELLLPGVDGFQLLRRLEQNEVKRPRVCIVLSVRGGEEDVLLALQLGADDFVVKPFSMDVLAARVDLALKNHGYGPEEDGAATLPGDMEKVPQRL